MRLTDQMEPRRALYGSAVAHLVAKVAMETTTEERKADISCQQRPGVTSGDTSTEQTK